MRPLLLPAVALVAAGIGGGSALPVTITPHAGRPATTFVVSFVVPATTGVVGYERVRDQLSVETDQAQAGCQARQTVIAPSARRGRQVHVDLAAPTASRWCTGQFKGRLVELRSPACPPRSLCPAYIRIRSLASFGFTVR